VQIWVDFVLGLQTVAQTTFLLQFGDKRMVYLRQHAWYYFKLVTVRVVDDLGEAHTVKWGFRQKAADNQELCK